MALSTLSEPEGHTEEAPAVQPGQPRGLTVRQRFDALPDHLKAKILDKYRDWNVDHLDWWDCVYDQFKEDMENIGIEVDKMYFSGFWSQGDGACFEGWVSDWGLFLESLGYTESALIKHASNGFRLNVRHSGHYHHENCTRFDVDLPLPDNDRDQWFLENFTPYERHSLLEAVWMAIINKYDRNSLEREFQEAFKDHMRDLYSRLNAEYDHLTSDEAILDSLECNDNLEDAINDAMENDNA